LTPTTGGTTPFRTHTRTSGTQKSHRPQGVRTRNKTGKGADECTQKKRKEKTKETGRQGRREKEAGEEGEEGEEEEEEVAAEGRIENLCGDLVEERKKGKESV